MLSVVSVSFGGIGTFFFGGSILSCIEIIYLSIIKSIRRLFRKSKKTEIAPESRRRIGGAVAYQRRLNRVLAREHNGTTLPNFWRQGYMHTRRTCAVNCRTRYDLF